MGAAAVATAVICINFRRLNVALWLIPQKLVQPKDHPDKRKFEYIGHNVARKDIDCCHRWRQWRVNAIMSNRKWVLP